MLFLEKNIPPKRKTGALCYKVDGHAFFSLQRNWPKISEGFAEGDLLKYDEFQIPEMIIQ